MLEQFELVVRKYGECGVQAVIEQIERVEGIRSDSCVPLESRWMLLMQPRATAQQLAA